MPRSPSPGRDRKRDRSRSRDRHRSPDRDVKKRRAEEERRGPRERSPIRRDDRRDEKRDGRRDDRVEPRRDDRRDRRDDKREDYRRELERDDVKKDRVVRDERDRERDKERDRDRDRDREKDRRARRSTSRERGRRSRERDSGPPLDSIKTEEKEEGEEEDEKKPQLPGPPLKPKVEPLSLEELLKKKKEQQEMEAKPVFLSKKEREALALQRRAEQAEAQRERMDEARRLRESAAEQRRLAEERRAAEESRRGKAMAEAEREKVLEQIKQQYLGGQKLKKRILRPSEKFRFNFDWGAEEDTSKDLNPLYNNLHEAALLYGRGMRAGIDRREQKRIAASLEKDLMRKHRSAAGIEENAETRKHERERARLADQYDGFDMRVEKHWSEKKLEDMTERDWRIFREDYNISYKGNSVGGILPIRSWDEAPLPSELRQAIDRVGYKQPSAIQRAAIPLGLQFRDVIGVAETGSGKTAAFVIPMLAYIMKQPPMNEENEADGPYSLVMAPTRELAQQIEEETVKLAHFTKYRVVSVVGGQDITEQGSKLRRGCEIIVATPGRLADCIRRRYAVLNQCNYVVLDEADRMIDLGFEPQVVEVLDAMPSSNLKPENEEEGLEENRVYRTTYMFSATMPPQVERLARKYLRRPVIVNIGTAGRATENVTQRVMLVKENEKPHRLEQELEMVDEKRAIVFVNTKRQCDSVYSHLDSLGYRCTVLHGGKSQDQRETSIKGFRDDTFNILIATDVAGRGIDVPDVALVVNYDMANTIEAYTHRIGRTGRAGKKGVALTLLTHSNTDLFYDLKKFLEESKAKVPPELARHEASKNKPGGPGDKPKRSAETLFTH